MNKKLYLLGLLITFFTISCSNQEDAPDIPQPTTEQTSTTITLEQARADLLSLLNDINMADSRVSSVKVISEAYSINVGTTSRSDSTNALIHVFNFANDEGYAIMSGDNRFPSLISLADKGSLRPDEPIDNPGVAMFLNNVETELKPSIDVAPDRGGVTISYSDWTNTVYKPGGYCSVKWGQGSPYNMYCPYLSDNTHAVTGCVATAVAQLMSVYKHPQSYEDVTFDWDRMTYYPQLYASDMSTYAGEKVAELMELLGRSENLNMTYGKQSGADPTNIPRTLAAFGYSQPGNHVSYDTDEIIDEIRNGHAVLLSGYATKHRHTILGLQVQVTYHDGHCWLGHGALKRERTKKYYEPGTSRPIKTETETYYYILCNWGWNSLRDGYYLSKSFDTAVGPEYGDDMTPNPDLEAPGSYNFRYKFTTVTGIRK